MVLRLGREKNMLSAAKRWAKGEYATRRCQKNMPRKTVGVLLEIRENQTLIRPFYSVLNNLMLYPPG